MYYWEEMAIFKNKIDYFKNKSNTICPLPWIHVTTSPMGTFRPCCNTQLKLEHEGKRVDMRDGETFESVLHGPVSGHAESPEWAKQECRGHPQEWAISELGDICA